MLVVLCRNSKSRVRPVLRILNKNTQQTAKQANEPLV
jgi:hypothetical protein